MKKQKNMALCGLLFCSMMFAVIVNLSQPDMKIAGYIANEYLPPDAYVATDALLMAGVNAGYYIGGTCGMAIGCIFSPMGGAFGYCLGRSVGAFIGAF